MELNQQQNSDYSSTFFTREHTNSANFLCIHLVISLARLTVSPYVIRIIMKMKATYSLCN